MYAICSALNVSIDELFSSAAGAGAEEPPAPAPAAGVEKHSFHGALAKLNESPEEQQSPLLRPGERRQLVLDSGVTWEQLSSIHDSTVDFLHVRYEVAGSSVPDDKLTRHSGIEYGYIISGTLEVALAFDTYQLHAGDSIAFDSTTPHRLTNRGDGPAEAIWSSTAGIRLAEPHRPSRRTRQRHEAPPRSSLRTTPGVAEPSSQPRPSA